MLPTPYQRGHNMSLVRTASAGGAALPLGLAISGYADFNNTGAAQALTPDTWVELRNDKLGANTIIGKMPVGVALDIAADGRIELTGLAIDDQIFIRHDFTVTPQTNNQTFEFTHDVGTVAYPIGTMPHKMEQGGGTASPTFNPLSYIYIGDTNTLDGGIMPKIKTTGNATVQYKGCAISIVKRNV